ncbi:MAG: hypothetical protein Q9213_002874 [Squamulea squamosa]
MGSSSDESQRAPDTSCGVRASAKPIKDSAVFTQKYVTEDLHPAFAESQLSYESSSDCFVAELDDTYDEAAHFDSHRAFASALEKFQQEVQPKYKSKVDLSAAHDWNEVMEYANVARSEYSGIDQKGIMQRIDHRLKTFQTAAPAMQAWLKLLPSTSIYGSVICGGLTIILEAAVRLRQLRKETLDALDQIPLCIEKAQFLVRTYGYAQVNQQMGNLYVAVIDALQHILEWYKRAAGLKFLSAFIRGPAFAENLKNKMKNVEKASQAMNERGNQREQLRLKEIRNVTVQTKHEVGDLKILAIEARNHLYAVLKDTEVWQEAMQSWKEYRIAKESRRASRDRANIEQAEKNTAARSSLFAVLGSDHVDQSLDEVNVLDQITSMTLGDQNRVGAIIEHRVVTDWLLDPRFGALLVNGNGLVTFPHDSWTNTYEAVLPHIHSAAV